jgi:ATP-dependent Lon protease
LKEKLLAAHRGGIRTVLIPDENTKDLAEIPQNIKESLDIKPVKWIDEVLEVALERMPEPLTDDVYFGKTEGEKGGKAAVESQSEKTDQTRISAH